ncbi:MAG: hypothetical protein V9F02_04260 [Chitinophagaceae bacterium]
MKKLILSITALTIFLFACKKSGTDTPQNNGLPTSAETKAQFNNTSFGVYIKELLSAHLGQLFIV